jgi:predicted transcriptional regulator
MSNEIKELPTDKNKEIVDAINQVGTKEILVNVSRSKLKPDAEFVFMFIDKFYNLLEDTFIQKQDIRVLIAYAKKMLYGNQISISQLDIADELGLDKSQVSKSVTKLTKFGVFYKEGRSLYMNWKFLAKGNLTDFIQTEKDKSKLEQTKKLEK